MANGRLTTQITLPLPAAVAILAVLVAAASLGWNVVSRGDAAVRENVHDRVTLNYEWTVGQFQSLRGEIQGVSKKLDKSCDREQEFREEILERLGRIEGGGD